MSVIVKGMKMPTECGLCDFITSDGECMAMGGDDLWEFIPDEPYFPDGWKCNDCPLIELPEKHGGLIDIYVRDKTTNEIHRVGDDPHDMLTITEANELCYHNLQNGDGCRTGDDCGGYEFVPNEDEHGYNADPRREGDTP